MIIDFHTHIVPPDVIENRSNYIALDHYFGVLYGNPKARLATAEELISSMDEAGIDISVITNFGWASPEICLKTNDYLLEAANKYSNRLVAFCMVQPKAGDAALREIERCASAGARGLGEFMPDGQGFGMDDIPLLQPVVEEAKRHNLLFLTHSSEPLGHDYPGKGHVTPDVLFKFLCAFPGFPIICAHWGGGLPLYCLMPKIKGLMDSAYFDSAASPFLYDKSIFPHVCEMVGAERVLMGSDYPLISQRRMVRLVDSLDIEASAKDLILGGNAKRLLESMGKPL